MTLTVRTAQMRQMADAQPGRPIVQPCANHVAWIEFRLVDNDGDPVPGERYKARMPDQSLRLGRLDSGGSVRFENILPGQAEITFPGIDSQEWWPL